MIIYYLKEAVRYLLNSKMSALITVITMTLTIILTILSLGLIITSNRIEKKLTRNVKVHLFLDNKISQKQVEKIRAEIKDNSKVKSVRFLSKEEALKEFIKISGENFTHVLDENPLPPSFIVTLNESNFEKSKLEQVISDFSKLNGVEQVSFDYDYILSLLNIINSVKSIIYALALFLIISSFYLVYSLNRFIVNSKKDLFNTMKLVGTKISTIKMPLILNGLIIGVLSGILSMVFIDSFFLLIKYVHLNLFFTKSIYIVNLAALILGIFFGVTSSYYSVKNISLRVK